MLPPPPMIEVTQTSMVDLAVWQHTDAEARDRYRAYLIGQLAYSAHIRGYEFDHWPKISEQAIDPQAPPTDVTASEHKVKPTHILLHGRVWCVRIGQKDATDH